MPPERKKEPFLIPKKLPHAYSVRKGVFQMEHFSDTAILQKSFPTGKGIGIAVLDTGISPVADFTIPNNRIAVFRDFISGRTTPYDDNGHGTHVAGAKKETTPMFIHRRCLFPFSYNAFM